MKETFLPWHRTAAEEFATKRLEKMQRAKDDEMNRIKREQFNRLHDQANTMANSFRRKKLESLVQKCLAAWRRGVLETQAERITVKLTRECESRIMDVQKKI